VILLFQAKPNCLVFLDNDTVVVGGESKEAQVHSLIEKSLLKSWDAHQTRLVETARTFFQLIFAKQWAALRVLAQWSRKLCNKIILILFKCARFYLCTLFLFGRHIFQSSILSNYPLLYVSKMLMQDPSSSPSLPLHSCHCQQL